jgi:hypothetical protein
MTELKKQSQRPGAILPICGGWARKNEAKTLRSAAACLRLTGFEKTKPAPWCDPTCLWWLGTKERSQNVALRSRLPAVDRI